MPLRQNGKGGNVDMKLVEAILAGYETKVLKARLLEFPALIRAQKDKAAAARQSLKEAELDKAEAEAELMVIIAAETNLSTGKPTYSNAESRTAELLKRKKNNPDYQAAAMAVRGTEYSASETQFDLEQLQDQFKAYRYIVDLTARELALMAGNVNEDQQGEPKGEPNKKEPF
jgi:hypothetical protein